MVGSLDATRDVGPFTSGGSQLIRASARMPSATAGVFGVQPSFDVVAVTP